MKTISMPCSAIAYGLAARGAARHETACHFIFFPSLLLLLFLPPALQVYGSELRVGAFSDLTPGSALPPAWELLTFPRITRHTEYQLVEIDGTTVIKAESRNAASGLIRRITIDPRRYPTLRWRWRVDRLLPGSDVRRKAGDDYPARLYLTFAYDADKMSLGRRMRYQAARLLYGDVPAAAINYIWARNAARNTVVPNAYTDFTMMIVVESGSERLGQWITEERNIVQDYRRAFGSDPPLITGVAIMTDSDDSGGEASAYYGDITFLSSP